MRQKARRARRADSEMTGKKRPRTGDMCGARGLARQIIAGDEPLIEGAQGKKPLSVAVEELNEGRIQILNDDAEE